MITLLTTFVVTALAGEIEVEMQTPVLFKVDGQLVNDLVAANRATELAPGEHLVSVENLLGRTVATLAVDVPADQRVTVRYAKKALSVVGSRALAPNAIAARPAGQTAAEPRGGTGTSGVSIAFTGLNATGYRVVVGETELTWSSSHEGFLATGLVVGAAVPVAVHKGEDHVRTDSVTIPRSGHLICDLQALWGERLALDRCVRTGTPFTEGDRALLGR